MQKLTCYSSSSQWYEKHGGGITSFKLPRNFTKVIKKTELVTKTPILQISGSWVGKIVKFYPQSVLAKTDRLSFPIVVVYETWWWYYWFGRGASYSKSDAWQKGLNQHTNFVDFCQLTAKNCKFLPLKIHWKIRLAILPLCNGMWNLAMVLQVWLWCIINHKWKNKTDFVISAQTCWVCQFIAIFYRKLLKTVKN